jgi:tetratricopeptide (TPR) repeat protein
MRNSCRTLLFLACVPLLAEQPDDLLTRIRASHLPEEQRNLLAASFSAKNYARIEEILDRQAEAAGAASLAAELHALAGNAAFLNGRMDRAILAFRQADSQVPLAESDRFMLAMALVNLGDTKAAREQLGHLNNSHPDRPLYLYWLGRVDYFERLYPEAVEKLKRVILLDPTSARAYDNLGLAYDMLGQSDEAREALLKAVDLNRKLPSPSAWPPHNLGYLLLRLREPKEAENALRESLKYDPRFATAHYHLGRALEAEDRDNQAIDEYRAAISLDPALIEPLYSLGLVYRRHNRLAEAEAAFAAYKKRKALEEHY